MRRALGSAAAAALLLTACYLGTFEDFYEAPPAANAGNGGAGQGGGAGAEGGARAGAGAAAGEASAGGAAGTDSAGAAGAGTAGAAGAKICIGSHFSLGGSGGSGGFSPSEIILGQKCTASNDPNPCYKCDDTHCCEVYAACQASDDCKEIQPCMNLCTKAQGVGTCIAKCLGEHPLGAPLYARRLACVETFCAEPCGATPHPCTTCQYTQCTTPLLDCRGDVGCLLLTSCVGDCQGNKGCEDLCYEQFSGVRTLGKLSAMLQCGSEKCLGECNASPPKAGPDGILVPTLFQTCTEACTDTYCDSCQQGLCCESYGACIDNDACAKLLGCVRNCPRAEQRSCERTCVETHPQGAALYAPHAACREVYCVDGKGACGWEATNPCEIALLVRCPSRLADCDSDPVCHQRRRCVLGCKGEAGCEDTCAEQHPGAQADERLKALRTCAATLCAKSCKGEP